MTLQALMRALLVQFQQKMTKAVDIQVTVSMRLTAIHAVDIQVTVSMRLTAIHAVDIQVTVSMRLTAIHATVIMSNQNTVCMSPRPTVSMNTPFPFTVLAQSQSVSAAVIVDHQALITFQPAVVSSMKSIIGHPLWIYPG